MSTNSYSVHLSRQPEGDTTVAAVRDFTLTLSSKAGDSSVGFNPVETLLSAAGACITSSLGLVAKNSDVSIGDVKVTVTGTRQSDPPQLVAAEVEVALSSPETDKKLERVFRIAERSSTILSTLREALELQVTWKRLPDTDA